MENVDSMTLATELSDDEASVEIAEAVSARHKIARKYVMWMRKKNPEATPAEVVRLLEKHYGTSIATAGALITAGVIAADVGIAMIPIAGAAAVGVKSAGQQAAKKGTKVAAKQATKLAMKAAAKGVALDMAKGGAQKAASFLPAGDEQIQFELTAVFALALADIHEMALDQDQSHALVYGLSNGRVSQKQIATMATDLSVGGVSTEIAVGNKIAAGRGDWSHWANTLADSLPGGAAQSLIRTVQTGQLDSVREHLGGQSQAVIEYGVGAVVGGMTRFVFGREVIEASRTAFAVPPESFPDHLAISQLDPTDNEPLEQNRAVMLLQEAGRSTGGWITGTATSMGSGVANAAGKVSRPFRSVDIDGDGIPDEPQALTKAKNVSGKLAGIAGSTGTGVAGLFKGKRSSGSAAVDSESSANESAE